MNYELNEINRAIGKLQGEVSSGFKNINKRLDIMNGGIKEGEKRINDLESEVDKSKGVLAIIGSVAGIVASFILNLLLKVWGDK